MAVFSSSNGHLVCHVGLLSAGMMSDWTAVSCGSFKVLFAPESTRLNISRSERVKESALVCHEAKFSVGNKHFHLTFHLVLGVLLERE